MLHTDYYDDEELYNFEDEVISIFRKYCKDHNITIEEPAVIEVGDDYESIISGIEYHFNIAENTDNPITDNKTLNNLIKTMIFTFKDILQERGNIKTIPPEDEETLKSEIKKSFIKWGAFEEK